LIPHQWYEDPLEECVIEQFPKKVSRIPEYFLIIAPVLTAFFRYLEREKLQPHAGAMAEEMERVQTRLLEAVEYLSRNGFSRQIVIRAREQGIDVTDRAAMLALRREFEKSHPGP